MKSLILGLALFTSLFVSASECSMTLEDAGYCASIEWLSGPTLNVKSSFRLTFWNADDADMVPTTPEHFNVKIYSWMIMHNGHNHGGPKMTVKQVAPGVYEVHDARFFMHGMHGYWQVRVELEDSEGISEIVAHRVNFN